MKKSVKFLQIFLVLMFSTSCTVYRNQGRKNFENEAGSRAVIASALTSLEAETCPSMDSDSHTLVYSDPEYQVWLDGFFTSDVLVERNTNCSELSCEQFDLISSDCFTLHFSTDEEMQSFLDQLI